MENSLTNFMLETILKIQSLTETKVFLLLESPGCSDGGRRYCGTRDLVELFESAQLASKTADVEVSLDPSINTLVEKTVAPSQSTFSEQRPRGAKKRSLDNHASSTAIDSAPPVKRLHVEESDGKVVFAVEMAAVHSEEDLVKREVEEYVIGDSDDEGDQSSFGGRHPNASIHAFRQHPMTSNSSISAVEDGFDMPEYRPSNELCARKLEALQSIENASAVFEKGTLENKLLSR